MFFFFFQAEDGIRDVAVTGVQTCALPISRRNRRSSAYDGCQPPGAEGGRTVARKGPAVSRQNHPGTEQNRSLAKAQATPSEIGRAQRLNSSHGYISYAVFCLKKKKKSNKRYEYKKHVYKY